MALPLRRFTRPTQPARVEEPRTDVIEPVLGFDYSQPAVDLRPGQTPDSENWIAEDGWLVVRSGASRFADSATSLSDVAILSHEHQTATGQFLPVVASAGTVLVYGADASDSWSTLSYVSDDPLSGSSLLDITATDIFDPTTENNWLVLTNGHDLPKYSVPSLLTMDDVPDFSSVESYAKFVYSLDNRLCFFHCASSSESFPNRVRWSARGVPSNFSGAAAGFDELLDMRGDGAGVAVREYDALLFSSKEIWVQRPRRDIFAFDFVPLSRGIGTRYHRSIAVTPIGVVFLGEDLMFYLVQGNNITPVGGPVHTFLRDSIVDAEKAFGLYNSRFRRYEFYYRSSADADRPRHALFLADSGAWFAQSFEHEVSSGVETAQDIADQGILIDDVSDTIDSVPTQIDQMIIAGSQGQGRNVMLASSAGTTWMVRESQPDDDGSTITAYWDSHGMSGEDPTRQSMPYELWYYYRSAEAGNLDLYTRAAQTDTFNLDSSNAYVTAADGNRRAPVAMTPLTGEAPQFRIQTTQGRRIRIGRFHVKLRDSGIY